MRYPHLLLIIVVVIVGLPLLAVVPSVANFVWNQDLSNVLIQLVDYPGFTTMLSHSAVAAVVTLTIVTGLALVSARYLYTERAQPHKGGSVGMGWMGILSMPHLAFAVAILWLAAPTGWLWRLVPVESPWMPWFDRQYMVSLWIILIAKELPFLWFMTLRALQQLPFERWLLVGRSQGHSESRTWWLVVIPALLQRLRLPLCVVAVYSLTVVDLALFAAPQTPAPLAVQVAQWQLEFDPQSQLLAFAGSLLLLILAGLMCGWVCLQERFIFHWCQRLLSRSLSTTESWLFRVSVVGHYLPKLFVYLAIVLFIALLALVHGHGWFYPALVPQQWDLALWQREWQYVSDGAWRSLWIAMGVASISLVLCVITAEWQRARQQKIPRALLLLPLLVPQIFLVLVWIPWSQTELLWVVWAHVPFSYAYALLAYLPAEERFEQRYLQQSQTFGYSFWQAWWRTKRPLLQVPLLTAFALAMLVSIAQYVPTVFIGGGRVPTLTTDFVALSSGSNVSMQALYALTMWLLCAVVLILIKPRRKNSSEGEMR
ncbi:MAG TPA: ABC transporter permease subunit [Pseudidiomarina sp.]|nr:ABC transporter permease subunit [Pseudidiomarina sp.]